MTSVLDHDARDLFGLTAALIAVPSESHHEAELARLVERRLRERAPSLAIDVLGSNVIARTQLGRDRRVVLGG
ncbi:MAG: succinyl-diaminopimelate desuccinylase, partial [Acidimicrobiia bacterium]